MKLVASMKELTPEQRKVSDTVTGLSVAFAGIVAVCAMPLAANAQRMSGYSLPQRPTPAPAVSPYTPPAPAPTYQTPAPRPQPAPVQYGTFRAYGPLPEGRVNVRLDSSFESHNLWGYTVYTQDNGERGNDQMVIDGPEGREAVWLNCWVTEEWKSFGPNSEEFVHAVVTEWCGWNES